MTTVHPSESWTLGEDTAFDPSWKVDLSKKKSLPEYVKDDVVQPDPTLTQAVVTMQPIRQSRNIFDPVSRQLFHEFTHLHKSHHKLTNLIHEKADLLYNTTIKQYDEHHDHMTYEQMLETLLFEGERLLLDGQYIYYTNVTFLDEDGEVSTEKPPMTKGRAFLTTNRLLLLSAEDATVASLVKPEGITKKSNLYRLSLSLGDSIYVQSLPVEGFRSVDLRVNIGVKSEINMRGQKPICSQIWSCLCCCIKPCCACCKVDCCMKQWRGDFIGTDGYNERCVTIGTLVPPWGKRMMVKIHFDPSMRLSFVSSFLVEMERHAPNLNKLDLAPVRISTMSDSKRQEAVNKLLSLLV